MCPFGHPETLSHQGGPSPLGERQTPVSAYVLLLLLFDFTLSAVLTSLLCGVSLQGAVTCLRDCAVQCRSRECSVAATQQTEQ